MYSCQTSYLSVPILLPVVTPLLLCMLRRPHNVSIDVQTFSDTFVNNVAKVRATTCDAPVPIFTSTRKQLLLQRYTRLMVADTVNAIRQLPDKSSAADPILTSVLKMVAELVAPFITEVFNCSLDAGHFPSVFKEAFITPVILKSLVLMQMKLDYIGRSHIYRCCRNYWNASSLDNYLSICPRLIFCLHFSLVSVRTVRLTRPKLLSFEYYLTFYTGC